ncbi:hypothetical protein [Methanorbis furvi]|uniref:DUF5050 domain-containing protein n=1 Tax=Methanorbis furvi TaxID=3028299 RepID=A0AAE4S8V5_9EURY|nr:hypothetical protein [Methanocorpusculaceae archaeon Ag1]
MEVDLIMGSKLLFTFIFSLLIIMCLPTALALEVKTLSEPQIIHESTPDYFVRLSVSDDRYIVMPEFHLKKDKKGRVHLYDLSQHSLSTIPESLSAAGSNVVVANGVIYFIGTNGFYSYIPESNTLVKLDISVSSGGNGFATDGVHFINWYGNYWPRDLTFMLYNFQTGEKKQIFPGGYPDPNNPMFLSGDYFVYSDSGMLVADPSKRYLYAYNISSGETTTLPKENGYSQYLENIWGDTIVYSLFSLVDNEYPDPLQYRMLNLKTHEKEPLILPNGIHPSQIYPPHALMSQWDEGTGVITVKLVEVDLPPIVRSTIVSQMEEQTLSPQPTQTGTPLGMTVGLIAFALACVLAVLWRKK